MLKEYADKNGFCNCQYYVDDGYSGVSNNRPDYQRMLKDVENELVGTPERYDSLASGYEKEQSELKQKLQELDSKTNVISAREKCVRDFIANAKKIVKVTEVTPTLLIAFISRIEVYEKEVKHSRKCTNRINIRFSFTTTKAFEADGIMIDNEKIPIAV